MNNLRGIQFVVLPVFSALFLLSNQLFAGASQSSAKGKKGKSASSASSSSLVSSRATGSGNMVVTLGADFSFDDAPAPVVATGLVGQVPASVEAPRWEIQDTTARLIGTHPTVAQFEALLADLPAGIQHLNLSDSGLTDASLVHLAAWIRARHPPLRTLNIERNLIGGDGARTLADLVRVGNLNQLEELNLARNQIGQNAGAMALFEAVTADALPRLRTLNLAHNEIADLSIRTLARALAGNRLPALLALVLDGNVLGDTDGVQELIRAAARHATLTQLGLAQMVLGNLAMMALANAVADGGFASLQRLDLSLNHVDEAHTVLLADALLVQRHQRLESLDLHSEGVDEINRRRNDARLRVKQAYDNVGRSIAQQAVGEAFIGHIGALVSGQEQQVQRSAQEIQQRSEDIRVAGRSLETAYRRLVEALSTDLGMQESSDVLRAARTIRLGPSITVIDRFQVSPDRGLRLADLLNSNHNIPIPDFAAVRSTLPELRRLVDDTSAIDSFDAVLLELQERYRCAESVVRAYTELLASGACPKLQLALPEICRTFKDILLKNVSTHE